MIWLEDHNLLTTTLHHGRCWDGWKKKLLEIRWGILEKASHLLWVHNPTHSFYNQTQSTRVESLPLSSGEKRDLKRPLREGPSVCGLTQTWDI